MCEVKKLAKIQTGMYLAFEVQPAEIWQKIFNYLRASPSDLVNCMNTCVQWYNLLKSERTTVMFPDVFKILAESKEVDWSRKSKGRRAEDDGNQPLTRTRVLNCRLVSKLWNDTILSFIQWHPTHFQLEELASRNYSQPPGQQNWQRDLHNWSSFPMVEQFSRTFGAGYVGKNPFLTRSLRVTDSHFGRQEIMDGLYEPRIFYRLVTRILEILGDNVWYFYVDVSFPLTSSSYYVLLRSWLTSMPNLKTLRIYYNANLNDDDPDFYRLRMPIENMMVLHNQIESNPLPVLEHLRVLELSSVPPPLALSLLGKCGDTLERLAIKGGILNRFPHPFSYLPEMKCLKMASIILDAEYDLVALENAFVSQECANLWPLESLYFSYKQPSPQILEGNGDVVDFCPSWERLFRFVNLFKDTLTELRLDLPGACHDFERRRIYRQSARLGFKLQLPNLKKLRVMVWSRTSMDFLLPLKNLEELEICKPMKLRVPPMAITKMKTLRSGRKIWIQKKPSEIIKCHGWYMTRMVDSNIWQKLPRLRVLKVMGNCPKEGFNCHVYQVYRVVKREENGRVEVARRVTPLS